MPRRILNGVVTSSACDKTVTVKVIRQVKHAKYKKYIRISKKYHAHDEKNEWMVGDRVSIGESSPISKTKCWIVLGDRSAAVGVQS
ncbi:MAG: 30S ribosomal protein S17 [Holosporaceae bacterium]|jgi:small subunit ribosomal protein S17|nr:30S ribosomal protein S17 [Holosporaceae bacterium]